jgi:hypothetical protein
MTGAVVVPNSVVPLLTSDNLAVVATVHPEGQPATAHMWIDFDGEQGTEYAVRDVEREIFTVELEHVRSSAG